MEPPLKKQAFTADNCSQYAAEKLEQYIGKDLAQLTAFKYYLPWHETFLIVDDLGYAIGYPCCIDCTEQPVLTFRAKLRRYEDRRERDTTLYKYYSEYEGDPIYRSNAAVTIDICGERIRFVDSASGCLIEHGDRLMRSNPKVDTFVGRVIEKVEEDLARRRQPSM